MTIYNGGVLVGFIRWNREESIYESRCITSPKEEGRGVLCSLRHFVSGEFDKAYGWIMEVTNG